jgi:hypothetical protein
MWSRHWTVPSKSEPGVRHHVSFALGPDPVSGEPTFLTWCDCKAYKYKSRRQLHYECKHISLARMLYRNGLQGGSKDQPFTIHTEDTHAGCV